MFIGYKELGRQGQIGSLCDEAQHQEHAHPLLHLEGADSLLLSRGLGKFVRADADEHCEEHTQTGGHQVQIHIVPLFM